MGCIFCDFVSGKRKIQMNGLPFLVLRETENTVSFLSMSFPKKEDGHVLVIPKNHYTYVEEIPKYIHHELTDHVIEIVKIIRETHEGCNILLNDGKSAGQTIFHAHYHIVPRDFKDDIKIEVWKNKKVSKEEFGKIHKYLRKKLSSVK